MLICPLGGNFIKNKCRAAITKFLSKSTQTSHLTFILSSVTLAQCIWKTLMNYQPSKKSLASSSFTITTVTSCASTFTDKMSTGKLNGSPSSKQWPATKTSSTASTTGNNGKAKTPNGSMAALNRAKKRSQRTSIPKKKPISSTREMNSMYRSMERVVHLVRGLGLSLCLALL